MIEPSSVLGASTHLPFYPLHQPYEVCDITSLVCWVGKEKDRGWIALGHTAACWRDGVWTQTSPCLPGFFSHCPVLSPLQLGILIFTTVLIQEPLQILAPLMKTELMISSWSQAVCKVGRGRKLESCLLYWELGGSDIRVDLKISAHAHRDVVSGVSGGRYGWLNNEHLPPRPTPEIVMTFSPWNLWVFLSIAKKHFRWRLLKWGKLSWITRPGSTCTLGVLVRGRQREIWLQKRRRWWDSQAETGDVAPSQRMLAAIGNWRREGTGLHSSFQRESATANTVTWAQCNSFLTLGLPALREYIFVLSHLVW